MEFPELKIKNLWKSFEMSASIKMDKSIIDKILGKDTDGDIMEKSYMGYEFDRHMAKEDRWIRNIVVNDSSRKTLLNEYEKGLIEGREIVWKGISVDRIIFNDPATIVFWTDGTKTVVKCQEGQTFNPYFGFCAAIAKKLYGNNSRLNRIVETYLEEDEDPRKDKCAWCVNSSNEAEDKPCVKCKVNMQNEGKEGLKSYWEGVK